jgi:hypothetical protein
MGKSDKLKASNSDVGGGTGSPKTSSSSSSALRGTKSAGSPKTGGPDKAGSSAGSSAKAGGIAKADKRATGSWYYRARNDPAALRAEIEGGARDFAERDAYGFAPLAYAARYGHADLIPRLVELGAKVDARDNDGGTPLHWAAYKVRAAPIFISFSVFPFCVCLFEIFFIAMSC